MLDSTLFDVWFANGPREKELTKPQVKCLGAIENFKDITLQYVRGVQHHLARNGMTESELQGAEEHFTNILHSHATLFNHALRSQTAIEDVCRELRTARVAWSQFLHGVSNYAMIEQEAAFRITTDSICKASWIAEVAVRDEKDFIPPPPHPSRKRSRSRYSS